MSKPILTRQQVELSHWHQTLFIKPAALETIPLRRTRTGWVVWIVDHLYREAEKRLIQPGDINLDGLEATLDTPLDLIYESVFFEDIIRLSASQGHGRLLQRFNLYPQPKHTVSAP